MSVHWDSRTEIYPESLDKIRKVRGMIEEQGLSVDVGSRWRDSPYECPGSAEAESMLLLQAQQYLRASQENTKEFMRY